MKAKVVFDFDGEHNILPIKNLLKSLLTNVSTVVEKRGFGRLKGLYTMYVTADEDRDIVLNRCKGIQSNAMYSDKIFNK